MGRTDPTPELGRSVPWLPEPRPQLYDGPFRTNVRAFLSTYGVEVPLPGLGRKVHAWLVRLVHCTNPTEALGKATTLLHVYEERLVEGNNHPPTCDQCRSMGWQHHPVGNCKYHFIVPSDAVLQDPTQLPAQVEALHRRPERQTSQLGPLSIEAGDGEDSGWNAPASLLDSAQHCLHGVLHCNGFGHLLRVNGRQSSDDPLGGAQLVSLWDALCALLAAQAVSVEDVSNKSGMLLRMLHAAAYRTTWYGKWGYKFGGRAPYNISRAEYDAAVEAVHGANVSDIMQDLAGKEQALVRLLLRYASWRGSDAAAGSSGSKTELTLGMVLQRMLAAVRRPELTPRVLVAAQPEPEPQLLAPAPPPQQQQLDALPSHLPPTARPCSSTPALLLHAGPVLNRPRMVASSAAAAAIAAADRHHRASTLEAVADPPQAPHPPSSEQQPPVTAPASAGDGVAAPKAGPTSEKGTHGLRAPLTATTAATMLAMICSPTLPDHDGGARPPAIALVQDSGSGAASAAPRLRQAAARQPRPAVSQRGGPPMAPLTGAVLQTMAGEARCSRAEVDAAVMAVLRGLAARPSTEWVHSRELAEEAMASGAVARPSIARAVLTRLHKHDIGGWRLRCKSFHSFRLEKLHIQAADLASCDLGALLVDDLGDAAGAPAAQAPAPPTTQAPGLTAEQPSIKRLWHAALTNPKESKDPAAGAAAHDRANAKTNLTKPLHAGADAPASALQVPDRAARPTGKPSGKLADPHVGSRVVQALEAHIQRIKAAAAAKEKGIAMRMAPTSTHSPQPNASTDSLSGSKGQKACSSQQPSTAGASDHAAAQPSKPAPSATVTAPGQELPPGGARLPRHGRGKACMPGRFGFGHPLWDALPNIPSLPNLLRDPGSAPVAPSQHPPPPTEPCDSCCSVASEQVGAHPAVCTVAAAAMSTEHGDAAAAAMEEDVPLSVASPTLGGGLGPLPPGTGHDGGALPCQLPLFVSLDKDVTLRLAPSNVLADLTQLMAAGCTSRAGVAHPEAETSVRMEEDARSWDSPAGVHAETLQPALGAMAVHAATSSSTGGSADDVEMIHQSSPALVQQHQQGANLPDFQGMPGLPQQSSHGGGALLLAAPQSSTKMSPPCSMASGSATTITDPGVQALQQPSSPHDPRPVSPVAEAADSEGLKRVKRARIGGDTSGATLPAHDNAWDAGERGMDLVLAWGRYARRSGQSRRAKPRVAVPWLEEPCTHSPTRQLERLPLEVPPAPVPAAPVTTQAKGPPMPEATSMAGTLLGAEARPQSAADMRRPLSLLSGPAPWRHHRSPLKLIPPREEVASVPLALVGAPSPRPHSKPQQVHETHARQPPQVPGEIPASKLPATQPARWSSPLVSPKPPRAAPRTAAQPIGTNVARALAAYLRRTAAARATATGASPAFPLAARKRASEEAPPATPPAKAAKKPRAQAALGSPTPAAPALPDADVMMQGAEVRQVERKPAARVRPPARAAAATVPQAGRAGKVLLRRTLPQPAMDGITSPAGGPHVEVKAEEHGQPAGSTAPAAVPCGSGGCQGACSRVNRLPLAYLGAALSHFQKLNQPLLAWLGSTTNDGRFPHTQQPGSPPRLGHVGGAGASRGVGCSELQLDASPGSSGGAVLASTGPLADLQLAYAGLVRLYWPVLHECLEAGPLTCMAGPGAAQAAVARAGLRLPALAGHLQVLKDAKYFVKDYGGPVPAALACATALVAGAKRQRSSGGAPGGLAVNGGVSAAPPCAVVRFMVQLQLPEVNRQLPGGDDGQEDDGLPAAAGPRGPQRQVMPATITPPEPVLVPARSTLAEARRAFTEALADVYRVCCPRGPAASGFKVTGIIAGLPDALTRLAPARQDGVRLEPAPPAQLRGGGGRSGSGPTLRTASCGGAAGLHPHSADPPLVLTVPDWHVVTVTATGLDLDPTWRQAGGLEDWEVNCRGCGARDDDGERMIACDGCGIWMHTRCCGMFDDADVPAAFRCELCQGPASGVTLDAAPQPTTAAPHSQAE